MMMKHFKNRFVALATAAVATGFAGHAAAQLTVVSFGGAYQEAQSKSLFVPAAKALGINIKEETYTGIAAVALQVKAGAVTWDVVTSGSGGAAASGAEGLLEPLDYKVIDASNLIPGAATPFFVCGDVFSTVIAWNTKTYGDKGPQSWADFWDIKKFPGKRSFRRGGEFVLEPALMADGVPPNKVYEVLSAPGGIERAIKKLKELKPHITVWWTSGAQHAQLMKDGEVDMITGWNGRFDAVAKDGGRVAYTFNQGSSDMDCYAIPKGAPNKANAMRFLNEIIKAPYQAEFTKYINYGPTNKKAFEGNAIPAAAARRNPSHPENLAKQLQIDQSWYVKNRARANALFQDMMTE